MPGMSSWIFKPIPLWLRSSKDLLMGTAKDFRLCYKIWSEMQQLPSSPSSNTRAAALFMFKCKDSPEEKIITSSDSPFHRPFTQTIPLLNKSIIKKCNFPWEHQTQNFSDNEKIFNDLLPLKQSGPTFLEVSVSHSCYIWMILKEIGKQKYCLESRG